MQMDTDQLILNLLSVNRLHFIREHLGRLIYANRVWIKSVQGQIISNMRAIGPFELIQWSGFLIFAQMKSRLAGISYLRIQFALIGLFNLRTSAGDLSIPIGFK